MINAYRNLTEKYAEFKDNNKLEWKPCSLRKFPIIQKEVRVFGINGVTKWYTAIVDIPQIYIHESTPNPTIEGFTILYSSIWILAK